ncbi:MAG: ferrous iron transport protein A [Sterolibacteriaceae bacterium]|nr:ferrous iron transport protein A [Sterolibacteriaceae bacterium]MBK9084624.1 ferrous iron transport protein A [Sterolibacteriaceae bacterium]
MPFTESAIHVMTAPTSTPLDSTPLGQPAVICAVSAPTHAPEWSSWLEEIGFIVGERVTVMTRGAFGGDPLVVRVGHSTFALRRAEAACVLVRLEQP